MVWSENPTYTMAINSTNYLIVRCFYHFYHTSPDTNIHMFLCQYYILFRTRYRHLSATKERLVYASITLRGLVIMGIFADFQLAIIVPIPFNLKQVWIKNCNLKYIGNIANLPFCVIVTHLFQTICRWLRDSYLRLSQKNRKGLHRRQCHRAYTSPRSERIDWKHGRRNHGNQWAAHHFMQTINTHLQYNLSI